MTMNTITDGMHGVVEKVVCPVWGVFTEWLCVGLDRDVD